MRANVLIELDGVAKSFRSADGAPRLVLDDVDFSLAEGEIVALLGKSDFAVLVNDVADEQTIVVLRPEGSARESQEL